MNDRATKIAIIILLIALSIFILLMAYSLPIIIFMGN